MQKISVVIPNYNGRALLEECLDSVQRQDYPNYEVIVVDDASTDSSLEYLKERSVRVIENDTNLGFAATVNRGIESASGELVLLLNNDVVLTPDFLTSIAGRIGKDHRIFSVSSKMLRYYEPEIIDDTGDMYTIFGWVFKRGDGDPATEYPRAGSVFSACAGAGLYRKDLIMQLGAFDVLHESYLEDVDLGWRARIEGYENVYEPNAVCYHVGSATMAGGERYSEKKVYLSARNNVYIIYKNMPVLQVLFNLPALILGFGIKAVYFYRRGFGKAYLLGVKEGFTHLESLKRVAFKRENTLNYLRVQAEMIGESIYYVGKKTGKLLKTALDRVFKPVITRVRNTFKTEISR